MAGTLGRLAAAAGLRLGLGLLKPGSLQGAEACCQTARQGVPRPLRGWARECHPKRRLFGARSAPPPPDAGGRSSRRERVRAPACWRRLAGRPLEPGRRDWLRGAYFRGLV